MNTLKYLSETNQFKKEQGYFKHMAGHIHSWNKKRKKKVTAKHNWARFILKLCQVKWGHAKTLMAGIFHHLIFSKISAVKMYSSINRQP